jgi:prepilin-type N-terminal cleavage/methylation domain-containing protein
MKIFRSKFTNGFTLVEVVVVIAIIAILTVIIFPSVNNIRAKNRDAEKVSDIATIQIGLSMFYSKNGFYPDDLNVLVPKFVPNEALTGPAPYNLYKYIPLTRVEGNSNCSSYHLGAQLELPNGHIDTAYTFVSTFSGAKEMNFYYYCNSYTGGTGLAPADFVEKIYNYNVHP